MAEKDADDNPYSSENVNNSDAAQALPVEGTVSDTMPNLTNKKKENLFDLNSSLSFYESSKKEENPFSFKKFLNQDTSAQKNKGARKKTYTPANVSSSTKSASPNHSVAQSHLDMNSRVINATDVSSVLPDFVQDHLVIEQCYLSGGSSAIDIDNLNLQNLPDLNLEHRNVHFMLNPARDSNHLNQHSSEHFSNLPDFTIGARNFQSVTQNSCDKRLPDFAVNAGVDPNDENIYDKDKTSKRKTDLNSGNDASQTRQRSQISSSPSVPLDLPSYDSNDAAIPFDLTAPAEEKSNSRGRTSSEAVSKSLPDFLSDGPIKKEFDENLQNARGNVNSVPNGLPPLEISSVRLDKERLIREIEYLRRQLTEKNRRLEALEAELQHIHSTDQRETASLEYALQEVENNLKQTAKRALNAEDMVFKLKQENKWLKSEICSLRSENVDLKLGNQVPQASLPQDNKSQKIAKELKSAANKAEQSLRSLLMGVDNLRALAASMESSSRFHNNSKEFQDFSHEDSASDPTL